MSSIQPNFIYPIKYRLKMASINLSCNCHDHAPYRSKVVRWYVWRKRCKCLQSGNLSDENFRKDATFSQKIRPRIVGHSVNLTTHLDHNVVQTLANRIYIESEEWDIAEKLTIYIPFRRNSELRQPITVTKSSEKSSLQFRDPKWIAPIWYCVW